MDELFEEISKPSSQNLFAGGVSISGEVGRGYGINAATACRLPSYVASGGIDGYGYCNGFKTGGLREASSSSGSSSTPRLTPIEDDPRFWLPDANIRHSASAMRLEELGLIEKLHLLQIQDNLTRGRSAMDDIITADPYSSQASNVGAPYPRNSVLPISSSLHERRTLPMGYSHGWIGDRRGFSYPNVSPDALLAEPTYPRYRSNDLHFNPNLSLINYEDSVNGLNNNLQYGFPVFTERASNVVVQPFVGFPSNTEALGFEDSFIMEGMGMPANAHNGNDHEGNRMTRVNNVHIETFQRFQMLNPSPPPLHMKRAIYNLARDQDGCRFLQKKIEERNAAAIDFIFRGLIDHVVELTENQFGNYLMQKLIDVCVVEQRMMIIFMLTKKPYELIRISLNAQGTRVVQKLIEVLKTKQEILLVTNALRPGFLKLIKDINGNHVVQKCLASLKVEDNRFIFDVAAKHCVDIATHQHGCCVLQSCITSSTGDHYKKLIFAISANGLLLARDPFGNYVVQHILDHGNQAAFAILLSEFMGNFVSLSMQKFGSNVVERFLRVLGNSDKAIIISELLQKETFEQLLNDPYGNYVIQCALDNTKGSALHASLVQAIRPFASKLKNNLYCRRIFSRVLRNDH